MNSNFFRAILGISILAFLSGCKDPPVKPAPRKTATTRTLSQVSANIDRLTAEELHDQLNTQVSTQTEKRQERIIDLSSKFTNETDPMTIEAGKRCPISQFPTNERPKIIRVSMDIRGVAKDNLDEVENRILNILNAHTPQPWEIRPSKSIDKHESVWAILHIDYRRAVRRLKRSSKTAPLRASYKHTFWMKFIGLKEYQLSWQDWNTNLYDETSINSEASINALFWQKLEQSFPTFSAIQLEEASMWIRAQGLLPQILKDELISMKLPSHRFYPDSCLVSNDGITETGRRAHSLRTLRSPYAPPQVLEVDPIDMACTRDATFIVSSEAQSKVALYYQTVTSDHSWKSQLTFQNSAKPGDIALYHDDDVVCLYTGLLPIQGHSIEIQCLDRRTGIVRWKTNRIPGSLRGFAQNKEQLVFVGDQAIVSLKRDGQISYFQRIQTASRAQLELSCQLGNRLIFTTGYGRFVSWNLDTHDFDWQMTTFDTQFIHCGQQNVLYISEAGGYILAIDIENNQPLWKYRTTTLPKDIMTYGEFVYFILDRAIVAVDRKTGDQRGQIPLPWDANQFISFGNHIYIDTLNAIYTWK